MRVKVAKHSGFCFGVRRAIRIAHATLSNSQPDKKIYSLGPIIHNPQVVRELERKGLRVAKDICEIRCGTVIISSHGAPKEVIEEIKRKRIELIDATCPFVKYAHDIVKRLKKEGYRIIIIGDKAHPEVKALLSTAGPQDNRISKIGVVSQTTQTKDKYIEGALRLLRAGFSEIRIFNSLCKDTLKRQLQARRLLRSCDAMVVVGGKNSANTRRLFEICKESGVDSYHIEDENDLRQDYFIGKRCIGVISGASTPDRTVKRVVKLLRQMKA